MDTPSHLKDNFDMTSGFKHQINNFTKISISKAGDDVIIDLFSLKHDFKLDQSVKLTVDEFKKIVVDLNSKIFEDVRMIKKK